MRMSSIMRRRNGLAFAGKEVTIRLLLKNEADSCWPKPRMVIESLTLSRSFWKHASSCDTRLTRATHPPVLALVGVDEPVQQSFQSARLGLHDARR